MTFHPPFSTEVRLEQLLTQLSENLVLPSSVTAAFRMIPRHHFVDIAFQAQAYIDKTIPIGEGQTISQPSIVALMTTLLDISSPTMRVLEIGTGSGFQSGILSCFTSNLYTIERHQKLSEKAQKILGALDRNHITYRIGDGTLGWPKMAPFDRIIVTAGAPSVPQTLIEQLAPEGKLLIPTGERDSQHLELYHKRAQQIERQRFENVLFVPLVGEKGWKE